ncbi:hypothetical protein BC835DRAFT_1269660 [Cytidiella melzeri]|nr:hypothetical protein BC835DRAFT_1269660 [Cytidiella melzeri]
MRQGGLPGIDEGGGAGKQLTRKADGRATQVSPPQPQQQGKQDEDEPEEEGTSPDDDKVIGLRLDLNLDVVVTLKARLHGDVTLSLL